MKKLSFLLAVIMICCIPVSAFAAGDDRILTNRVTFSITDGVASYYINIFSDSRDTSVNVRLWDGNNCIDSWSDNQKDTFIINRSIPVKKGRTYTLTVDVTVDGAVKPQIKRSAKS